MSGSSRLTRSHSLRKSIRTAARLHRLDPNLRLFILTAGMFIPEPEDGSGVAPESRTTELWSVQRGRSAPLLLERMEGLTSGGHTSDREPGDEQGEQAVNEERLPNVALAQVGPGEGQREDGGDSIEKMR